MSQFQPFKHLVEQYSGLEFNGIAEQRLHKEVIKNSESLGLGLVSYFEKIKGSPAKLTELVNQLTVNETYFYREPAQIKLFVQTLLPRLQKLAQNRTVRILSVGCSSGEEPYSLAMAIQETWGKHMLSQVQIDAGDLDEHILNKARVGVYSAFSFRALGEDLRKKYFQATPQGYQLNPEIRQAVRFFPFNLKAEHYPAEDNYYDVVFFRNVSIYFNLDTRKAIQHKLKKLMQPNAILLLGSSETLGNDFDILDLIEEQGQYYFVQGAELLQQANYQRPLDIQVEQPKNTAPTADGLSPTKAASMHSTAQHQPKLQTVTNHVTVEQVVEMLHDSAQYPQALVRLEKITQQEPDNAPAILMKGWIALNQKDFNQAQKLIEQALELRPWCVDALIAQGLCHKWQSELELAVQSFKKACYANPESWLAHYQLADALKHLQDSTAAQQAFQTVRRILSHNITAHSGSEWLPLALPVKDVLFLAERYLLNAKQQPEHNVSGA